MSVLQTVQEKFFVNVEELSTHNSLITLVLNNASKIAFILETAIAAYKTDNAARYLPTPLTYWQPLFHESNFTATELKAFFDSISNVDRFVNRLHARASVKGTVDSDLWEVYVEVSTLDPMMFKRVLYFTIFTNGIGFCEFCDEWYKKVKTGRNIMVFRVNSSIAKEEEFKAQPDPAAFMFHGTDEKNFYSISRNGIMSMSNQAGFMSHGAAYGPGVYLSDRFDVAYGYSRAAGSKVVLCYEVKNHKRGLSYNGHRTPENFYVMRESDICLRAIIWMRDSFDQGATIATEVVGALQAEQEHQRALHSRGLEKTEKDQALSRIRGVTTTTAATEYSTSGGYKFDAPQVDSSLLLTVRAPHLEPAGFPVNATKKRVIMEMNELMNNPPAGFIDRINHLVPGKIESPLLVEVNIPRGSKLYRQGEPLGIDTMIFACYLPLDYPFSAVQIRVVTPKIKRHTGHVTIGGSVCADVLYNEGWTPGNTILSSLMSCMSLIADDTIPAYGEIDEKKLGEEYSYQEFQAAYSFTGTTHSWKA